MRMKGLLSAALMSAVATAQASDLNIFLSKETAQFELGLDMPSSGMGEAQLEMGLFFNEDSDYMGSLGLKVLGSPAGQVPLSFGVGAKAYAASIDTPERSVGAVGIGGEVRLHIPAKMPMSVGLEGYYAPDITTFSDATQLSDLRVDYRLEVTPGTAFFVGARRLETKLKGSPDRKYRLDNNAHVGITLSF